MLLIGICDSDTAVRTMLSDFIKEVEQGRSRRGQNRFFIETNDNGVYYSESRSLIFLLIAFASRPLIK